MSVSFFAIKILLTCLYVVCITAEQSRKTLTTKIKTNDRHYDRIQGQHSSKFYMQTNSRKTWDLHWSTHQNFTHSVSNTTTLCFRFLFDFCFPPKNQMKAENMPLLHLTRLWKSLHSTLTAAVSGTKDGSYVNLKPPFVEDNHHDLRLRKNINSSSGLTLKKKSIMKQISDVYWATTDRLADRHERPRLTGCEWTLT